MTTVAPIAGHHAIKTVSFGLEWQMPLREDLLSLLRTLHGRVRDRLPRVVLQEGVDLKIVVNPAPPVPPIPHRPVKPRLVGLMFDDAQADGDPGWSLVIQRNFLAVNCHRYSRWHEIWPQARELLIPFFPILARECGIAVIGLQYVDQFRATGPEGSFKPTDLWLEGSPLLPPDVFKLSGLWHSHHGYFENQAEPRAHRCLNTIDVDLIETDQGRLIQITTAHRAFLDQPARDEKDLLQAGDQSQDGELHHLMLNLHRTNKSCLRQLLSPAMCQRIHLGAD